MDGSTSERPNKDKLHENGKMVKNCKKVPYILTHFYELNENALGIPYGFESC